MVEFTKAELQRMGRLENQEFSVRRVVGDNGQVTDHLVDKGGWFGGRIARQHKINSGEDRNVKQGEYLRAKKDVLDSLKRIYGDEIGERAFRAHIGKTVNGVHRTSSDHPITGRHIRQMMKTAEKALNEQVIVQRFNRGFRDNEGKVMSERATAAWMCSKSNGGLKQPNGQLVPFDNPEIVTNLVRGYHESDDHHERHDGRFPIGDYHYKLRGNRVTDQPTRRRQDEPKGTPIARSLFDGPPIGDIQRFWDRNRGVKEGFWTLELDLAKPVGGRNNHVIGIYVHRDDPDHIHVFDANRCEARIPRAHFEDWLNQHLDEYGKIRQTTLYRSEETLTGALRKRGEGWQLDKHLQTTNSDVEAINVFLGGQFQRYLDSPVIDDVYSYTRNDIDRFNFTIGDDDPPVKLTNQNVQESLLGLVKDKTDPNVGIINDDVNRNVSDQDRNACKALSCLLNQTIINVIDGALGDQLPVDTLDGPIIPQATENKDDLRGEIHREGDKIYIHYSKERDLLGFNVNARMHRLTPQTDYLNVKGTISITIDELRQAGAQNRAPRFQFEDLPEGHLHIEGYLGSSDQPVPGSRPSPTLDEALNYPSLITEGEWAPLEKLWKESIRDQDIVRFGTQDYDRPVPYSFDNWVRGNRELTVEGRLQEPISLHSLPRSEHERTSQPYMVFFDVAGGEREAMELAKLIDRNMIDVVTSEALIANGQSPDRVDLITRAAYPVDVRRVEDNGQQFVEIKLSQRIDPKPFDDETLVRAPEDRRMFCVSTVLRVSLEDLRKGQPENFTVQRMPFLEWIGELPPPIEEVEVPNQNENVGDQILGQNIVNPNDGNQNDDNVGNEGIVDVNQDQIRENA